MTHTEYTSLEKAVSKWYELKNSRSKVLGIKQEYYFVIFIILFLYFIISEDGDIANFFLNILLGIITLVIGFVTYNLYPSFVSRRERHGKSAYQFITRRWGYTVTFPIFFLFFLHTINPNKKTNNEDSNSLKDSEEISNGAELIENKIDNTTIENVVQDEMSENLKPSYSAPVLLDTTLEIKELPEQIPSLIEIDTTIMIAADQPEDAAAVESQPKKKKWLIFKKRKKDNKE